MKTFSFLALLLLLLLFPSCTREEPKDSVSFLAMDTYMTIQSYGKRAAEANAAAEKRVYELENLLSVTKSESEIGKINSGTMEGTLSADVEKLLSFSLSLAEQSDGAFNPCLYPVTKAWGFTTPSFQVPKAEEIEALLEKTSWRKARIEGHQLFLEPGMMVDLGAVAKGYAGDEILRVLKSYGIKSAVLSLGGNVQALGLKPDKKEWNIGIRNPWSGEGMILAVRVNNKAVVTSGGYERFFEADGKKYIHILNGNTGIPVDNGVISATIIADSGLEADGLSTTLFVLGAEEAKAFWKKIRGFEYLLVTEDGTLYCTKGLEGKLSFLYDFPKIEIVE